MNQILINVEPYEKRIAIVSARGEMEQFFLERPDCQHLAGNIYKGVISSVLPGMGSIFVDIGTGKNGFLYISDTEQKSIQALLDEEITVSPRHIRTSCRSILANLKKGQELFVQVVKEPFGAKGPLLTADITVPGKYLVLMPFNNSIGVSKRIANKHHRMRLKKILENLNLPDGTGCIARTQSEHASDREIMLEARYLVNLWFRIMKRASTQNAPSLIYEEYDLSLLVVRDILDVNSDSKLLVDSKDEYRKIVKFASCINSKLKKRIFYYRGKTPLFERFGIEENVERLFKRKISLKSGGSIVIERTESLVSIDVNTEKFTGRTDLEKTALSTNIEAAEEIAKQIMLRDIGGIIVIDFIDMTDRNNKRLLYEKLISGFRKDRAKVNIYPVSQVGLVEVTRQRTRRGYESIVYSTCPYCSGLGRIKSLTTIAIETIRRVQRISSFKRAKTITITVHPDVYKHIENSFQKYIKDLQRRIRKKIILKDNDKFHIEDVHIE